MAGRSRAAAVEKVAPDLKILHLWKGAAGLKGGGGGIALYRLHTGLRDAGIDSRILSDVKDTDDPYQIARTGRYRKAERVLKRYTSKIGLNDIHRISSFGIRGERPFREADVIHFHGFHSNFISYLALPWLTRDKPAVFTLHDMWALTGHCAYSYDCERWKIGCGKCPYPDTAPRIERDATRVEWKLKDWAYRHSKLTIVSPSRWLTTLARQGMLNRFPVQYIPHGIDTEIYQPQDTGWCRQQLGIPADKKVLLYVATRLHSHRKGMDHLMSALRSLPESLKKTTMLLLLGEGDAGMDVEPGIEVRRLGYVAAPRDKAQIYSAADLFVAPTRADNLPLTLMESLACGTPMISYAVGGVPELVRPDITGYLAKPGDWQDLQTGMVELLRNDPQRQQMSLRCREVALREYPMD